MVRFPRNKKLRIPYVLFAGDAVWGIPTNEQELMPVNGTEQVDINFIWKDSLNVFGFGGQAYTRKNVRRSDIYFIPALGPDGSHVRDLYLVYDSAFTISPDNNLVERMRGQRVRALEEENELLRKAYAGAMRKTFDTKLEDRFKAKQLEEADHSAKVRKMAAVEHMFATMGQAMKRGGEY